MASSADGGSEGERRFSLLEIGTRQGESCETGRHHGPRMQLQVSISKGQSSPPFDCFALICIHLDIWASSWLTSFMSRVSYSVQQRVCNGFLPTLHTKRRQRFPTLLCLYQLKATQETRWGFKSSTVLWSSNRMMVFSFGLTMGLYCSLLFLLQMSSLQNLTWCWLKD